jgi:hypothetical protein
MHLIRQFFAILFDAIGSRAAISTFMCTGCELNGYCHLPASRRRRCCEARALRGQP